MKKACATLGVLLSAALTFSPLAALADYAIKDGNANPQTIKAFTCTGSVICPGYVPMDLTGAAFGVTGNPFFVSPAAGATFPVSGSVSLTGSLPAFASTPTFNCGTGCSAGSGTFNNNADGVATSSTNGQSASWLYGWNGTTWDRVHTDTTNGMWVNVKSIVLPTGAATSAAQTTAQTSLTSIDTKTPALGQALAAASTPVVLPALQLTALTPLATVAVTQSTAANLNMTCANCSGSGASGTDGGGFTAGSSIFAPAGGFFQTTATSNPLTTGQWGAWQMTANRAGFVNLRDTSGAALGVSGNPTFAQLAAGSAAIGSLTAGSAIIGKVGIDQTTPGTTNLVSIGTNGTVNPQTAANWGIGTSTQNSASVANGHLVLGQFNTTPTTITSGNMSPLQLDTNGNVKVNIVAGASSGAVAQGSTTSGQTGGLIQGAVTTAAPTYTTAQTSPLSLDTAGNLRVNVTSATGVAQGATTSGLSGSMIMGAVTTSPPAYTTAQTSPLSMDTAGNLRVDGTSESATGAAPPASANYLGATSTGNLTGLISCDSSIVYDASTSGSTQLVALSSGKTIYVCGYAMATGAAATNVKLIYGTGTACATGSANLTGAYQLAANSGIVDHSSNFFSGMKTAASNALCINTSGANAVQATIYFTQF